LVENEGSQDEIEKVIQKIESLRTESLEFVRISDESRPG